MAVLVGLSVSLFAARTTLFFYVHRTHARTLAGTQARTHLHFRAPLTPFPSLPPSHPPPAPSTPSSVSFYVTSPTSFVRFALLAMCMTPSTECVREGSPSRGGSMYNAFSDLIRELSGARRPPRGISGISAAKIYKTLLDTSLIFHLDRSEGEIKWNEESRIF